MDFHLQCRINDAPQYPVKQMTKKEMRTSEANLKLINQAVQDYLMNLDLLEGKYEDAGLNDREIAWAIGRAQFLLALEKE